MRKRPEARAEAWDACKESTAPSSCINSVRGETVPQHALILDLASSPEVPVAAPNVPRQFPERKISGGPKVSRRWSSEALQPPHALRSRARKAVASFESKDRMRPPSRHVKSQAPVQGKAPDTSQVGCGSVALPGTEWHVAVPNSHKYFEATSRHMFHPLILFFFRRLNSHKQILVLARYLIGHGTRTWCEH